MEDIIPPLEQDVPMEAMPELTVQEELEMRVRTIRLLSDLSGAPLQPTDVDIAQANQLAHQMISNPSMRPDYSKYPNESIAFLAGMVAQSNCSLVDELSEYKNYVVTKLVGEIENSTSAKDRIAALRLLGDVDGVDAFKRRTETTVVIKPIEEVEKELSSVLEALSVRVISQSTTPVAPTTQEDSSADA